MCDIEGLYTQISKKKLKEKMISSLISLHERIHSYHKLTFSRVRTVITYVSLN